MTDSRVITCTNTSENIAVYLRRTSASPWYLSSFSGIYDTDYDVTTSANTLADGSQYMGSKVNQRNIVLTLANKSRHRSARALLARVFKPRSKGTLQYSDGTITRKIDYYTEKVSFETKGVRSDDSGVMIATVSLICPDPFFYEISDSVRQMSAWMPSFTFEHAFSVDGEEIGYRSKEKIAEISNESGIDEIGMDISIITSGAASNIYVTNATTNEVIRIGTDTSALNLVAGDVVEITTEIGNRHVWLTHEGTTTEINYLLSSDSSFLTLTAGTNVIGYGASSGVDNLSIEITYRMRYASV